MVICRTILEHTNLIIGIVICCGCLEYCHLELKSSVFIVTKKNSCGLFVAVIRSTAPENHWEIEREVSFLILLTVWQWSALTDCSLRFTVTECSNITNLKTLKLVCSNDVTVRCSCHPIPANKCHLGYFCHLYGLARISPRSHSCET